MSVMCKSASKHSRGLSRHRIKWPVSGNCGKVLLSCWLHLTVLKQESGLDGVSSEISAFASQCRFVRRMKR